MIQIDKDEIIKILSIESHYIPDSMVEKLKGHEEYKDMEEGLNEDLYSLETALYTIEWSEEEFSVITEISEICNENDASYWRIINKS